MSSKSSAPSEPEPASGAQAPSGPSTTPAIPEELHRIICAKRFREAALPSGLAGEPESAGTAGPTESASEADRLDDLRAELGLSEDAFANLVDLVGCGNAPVSDDFHAVALNGALWTFVSPRGDGSVTLNGTNALLSVPAGTSHDVWTGANNSIRIMQPISNVDFEVEVKWQSPVTTGAQLQGILVEQSPGNYLRFDLFHDGNAPRLFAASFVANTPTERLSMPLPSAGSTFWLRVQRAGNVWTMRYSTNGTSFTTAVTFSHAMVTSSIGPFAGTAQSNPSFTSSIDYFFNTASPIVPEDGPPDTTPPVLSAISATPAANTATIAWTTDETADSRVDYGTTTAYGTTVTDASFVTSHSLMLQNLFCGTPYNYRVVSADSSANSSSSTNRTFSTTACPSGGPVSDDFHAGSLNTSLWTFVNPLGDGSVSVNGTNALLALPSGQDHDVWSSGNNAVRIMQSTANTSFEVEVKFDSMVAVDHQLLGVVVEESPGSFIRFGVFFDGTTPRLFSATFVQGNQPVVRENTPLCVGPAPFWLRVKRVGNTWTQSWSTLGTSFISGMSFTHSMTVQKIGVYAGNVGVPPPNPAPAPAFTASIDYFFNTASPIVPEDGSPRPGTSRFRDGEPTTPVQAQESDPGAMVPGTGPGTGRDADALSAGVSSFTCVVPTDLANGDPASWTRAPLDAALIASPQHDAGPWIADTTEPPEPEGGDPFGPPGPTIDLWYGDTQTFGQNGRPQSWINILGKVSDTDGVSSLNYRLNGGAPQTLAIGPDIYRLVEPGDFNVEIAYSSLVPGSNTVLLTTVDGLGNTSTRTVTVNYVAGQTWPSSYSINWANVSSIGAVAQVTDGKWAIQPGGTVRTMQTGYDRLITLGDMNAWNSYEVRAEVTINSLDCNTDFGVGIVAGWKGHTGGEQPRVGHPFPGLGWYAKFQATSYFLNIYENTPTHAEHIMIQDMSGRVLHLGVKYIFKFRVEALSPTASRYRLKVWRAVDPEPGNFDLDVNGDRSQGSIVLGAHRADVSFGAVTVTGLP